MHPGARSLPWLLCLTFSAAFVGCQAAGKVKAPVENIEPDRQQRRQETVREFEAHRDDAQYKAAVASWQQGDANGCLDSLRALLKRNPRHAGGLKLLEELEQVADVTDEHAPSNFGVVQAAHHSATADDDQGSPIGSVAPRSIAAPADRLNTGNYDGGARGEVARRSVRQAVRALAAGDPKWAANYYRAAIAAENDNVQIPLAAAVMSLRYEQSDLALEMAQVATSHFSGSAAADRTLGVVYYRRGDYKASRIALERAISLDKSHPLSYFLMGSTLARLGETEAADWNFQQAHRLDPKFGDPR